MNTEVTGPLRAGIARVPAQVPPGLARSAYRRYRRRRVTARAAAAAGTAAVAGTAATVFLSGPAGPATQTQTTAYVVRHVTQALDAMPAGTIMFDRMTFGPSGNGPGFYARDVWATRGRSRNETFTQAGQPIQDDGISLTPTASKRVLVDYQNKTWWRSVGPKPVGHLTGPMPPIKWTCSTPPGVIVGNAADMAAQVRTGVSCGELKVGGTGTVDGAPAVKLAGNWGGGAVTDWVNATTYLPVRMTLTWGPGRVNQIDFQWLPPTAANLAKLNLPVPPAGFTQVKPYS
jgi:hypothetical protein